MTSLFGSKDSRIPKTKSVIRKMHRAREGVLPKQPKNLDFEFDDEFLKEPFLVGDVHVTGERHMMFATQTQLDLLTKARKWYLDGTFKAVHSPFVQLWSIHAFIREGDNMKQVPLMYVLMSRRRKQDYVAILQKVLDILEEAPAVECFTMDFEIALWQALREVFPSSKLKGCAFHWSQAVQKHVGEFGLARTYRERQSVHSLIRKLLALPFLPAADIKRAFRKLQEQAEDSSEQVQDLFTYVSDEWLESSKWSEDEWSVYRQTIRTNNDTEGWHRKLNTKAGRGKVKTYRLLEILLVESKLVNLEVTRLLEGSTSRRCRLSDEWLFDLWDQYDNHDIVCEEFLGNVGTYYGQF
ncbi:uncharacterized protein LOC123527520 [Mercenaria mercenaria]|uniref:uncharacterized protein LOC123527520 n=1 Tax=Mercenaria mercenaria TaxID=6596 RepID=UPI00234F5B81|nr:uncharacterized protein LOC123527520 [Mercenaria mercenaria]